MSKRFVLLSVIGIALIAVPLSAEIPDTLWTATFGGVLSDTAYSVCETSDGGYVVAGVTNSFGAGLMDVYLVKTNANGDTLWTKTYGGINSDEAWSVCETSDGGYILGGFTYSSGAGENDFWLVKTDSAGDTLWTGTYGGSSYDRAYIVQQTSDGGYILAGYTWSFGAGDADGYLVKTDSLGDTLWTKVYGGTARDWFISAFETADNGYIISGTTYSFGLGDADFWLMKADENGVTVWERFYGAANTADSGYVAQQTSDGGYVTVGTTGEIGLESDAWLIKTDALGDTLWSRTYGGGAPDAAYAVHETSDGGYILSGATDSYGAGDRDVYLIKTDANGDTLWTTTYGGTNADGGALLQICSDGGYIIPGYTSSFGEGGSDFYLVKTKPMLELTSPNGGEELLEGRLHTITWWFDNAAMAPHSYLLLLSQDGGISYNDTIASGIDPAETSYDWTVPPITSGDCLVKIQLLGVESEVVTEDESDDVFSLTGIKEQPSSVQPLIKVNVSLNQLTYEVSGKAQLTLYSADGRKVLEENLEGKGIWSAPFELTTGVYFARVNTGDVNVTARLVIIE